MERLGLETSQLPGVALPRDTWDWTSPLGSQVAAGLSPLFEGWEQCARPWTRERDTDSRVEFAHRVWRVSKTYDPKQEALGKDGNNQKMLRK